MRFSADGGPAAIELASQLARRGASMGIIAYYTGLGRKNIKKITDECGLTFNDKGKRKTQIGDWLELDRDRLIHALCLVRSHEATEFEAHPGVRIVRAYDTYRSLMAPLFTVDDVHDVVRLYLSGQAKMSSCNHCRTQYLTVSDSLSCPVCEKIHELTCKHCGYSLPDHPPRRGRRKEFCDRPDCVTERKRSLSESSTTLPLPLWQVRL